MWGRGTDGADITSVGSGKTPHPISEKGGNLKIEKTAIIKDGWALCPVHWIKLCKVDDGAKANGVKVWCKLCKEQIKLEI